MNAITALIPAYNAEATIGRALLSCLPQVDAVVVVNDGSTDSTAAIVRQFVGHKLKLVNLPSNEGIGNARQHCLEHCATPYAAWLDADDMFLPNRIATLMTWLQQGYDIVYDNMEIHSGTSGQFLAKAELPNRLKSATGIAQQFARNYIRNVGVPGINVSRALDIGYRNLRHAEDYDFLLRSLLAGHRVKLAKATTYRQYHYKTSVSNSTHDLPSYQRSVLQNIGLEKLRDYLHRAEVPANDRWRITLYFLANTAQWQTLLNTAKQAPANQTSDDRWLAMFMQSVALSKTRHFKSAAQKLQSALSIKQSPECLNNLAVCRFNLAHEYQGYLKRALHLKPDYTDAALNLKAAPEHITHVPLRSASL